jgi:threonine dehydrogenase-like Zn-dependent dehydrogenase
MKALRFTGGELMVTDMPVPMSEGEAIVRVTLSGICNTDLEIVRGYAGFKGTIGHEFVGVVEEALDSPDLVGKRVVGEINAGCGSCYRCAAGDPRHCRHRTVLGIHGRDGAHAEYLRLPTRNLLAMPDTITDEQAVFAEPMAAAFGITEQVDVRRETKIAVIGDGKLGLLCAMSLRLRSDNITLVGKHPEKLALVDDLGIEREMTGEIASSHQSSFDLVVEASGKNSGFLSALDLVRPRGQIILKSTFQGTPTWDASRVVVDEITVVGSRCGRFAPALALLAEGKVPVERLICETWPLSRGVEAISRAAQPGVLKILINPSK